MAFVGLKYCVGAPITTEVRGQALEYGTGVVIGRAIGANVNWTRNGDPLYSDDSIGENDNSLTGGTIDINTDDVADDALVGLMGIVREDGENGKPDVFKDVGDSTPYIGVGYIRVRRYKNIESYMAYWVHKTQLSITTESANTKAGSITWQTPTATGPIMGVVIGDDRKTHYRERVTFDTEAAAEAWLNAKANILTA